MMSSGIGEGYTQNDNRCGSVTDFLVLSTAELDHALCGGVRHLDFSENGVAVVGEHNAAHWVEQHLEHGLGTET